MEGPLLGSWKLKRHLFIIEIELPSTCTSLLSLGKNSGLFRGKKKKMKTRYLDQRWREMRAKWIL
jgi:hypothetical protein